MNKCTWSNCKAEATTPQYGMNGKQWANLCDMHHKRLHEELGDPVKFEMALSSWVNASGGPEVLASQMMPDLSKLSPREVEVAKLYAKGHTCTSIAKELFRSEKTISTHRTRIMEKLGIDCKLGWTKFLRSIPV